jgi:hypothetical protein
MTTQLVNNTTESRGLAPDRVLSFPLIFGFFPGGLTGHSKEFRGYRISMKPICSLLCDLTSTLTVWNYIIF